MPADDDRDRERVTPRQSSAWNAAPDRARIAQHLRKQLNEEAERAEKEGGDGMRAATALSMANDCLVHAHEFEKWAQGQDVGSDVRHERSLAWLHIQREVIKFLGDRSIRRREP